MTSHALPPFLPFFIFAALMPMLPVGRIRTIVLIALPIVGIANLLQLEEGLLWQTDIIGLDLAPVRVDRLSMLFGWLFHIGAALAIIFSLHLRTRLEPAVGLLYAGSAMGAIFAGDLITLFIFWELMALSSAGLIFCGGTKRATAAGMRYLMFKILSGVLLLSGGALHWIEYGDLVFGKIGLDDLAGGLIFFAFGIKCAFPLLHNWLTDAYPESSPTGTVFLGAFTTNVAVYALARGFPGTEALVYIGAVMACFPIFYAVIENDLRRVLAYSMINQLGFIVCGIGIGTAAAINAAVAHAFNDVIFKGLLMMSMGAVLFMTGRIKGSDLGGLHKSMPITTGLCIVGAAAISAFPLLNGFVSKSMVMSAAIEEGYDFVWFALLFAAAGAFHYAGIKIPFFAFFSRDSGIRTTEPPINMLVAMALAAFACLLLGLQPHILYGLLPYPTDYNAYDVSHVIAQLQLLLFSALVFVWLQRTGLYPPCVPSVNLDIEWLWRRLGKAGLRRLRSSPSPALSMLRRIGSRSLCGGMALIRQVFGAGGGLATVWGSRRTAVVLVATLVAGLLMTLR
ncbi:Na(+)/H(+) antiporter subunit D [Thioalkalivibrio sp. HK1]|uniref:Na(+)/H(+) antiporter subunit D n=1 Tax=Thioalkalivibrio sp. HK1 TaxID=1469245 RepID=UPI00046F0C62|nr:Na(+)/H(+) antiporter subunit D [Thioalkalivibrio sp. HK1]